MFFLIKGSKLSPYFELMCYPCAYNVTDDCLTFNSNQIKFRDIAIAFSDVMQNKVFITSGFIDIPESFPCQMFSFFMFAFLYLPDN